MRTAVAKRHFMDFIWQSSLAPQNESHQEVPAATKIVIESCHQSRHGPDLLLDTNSGADIGQEAIARNLKHWDTEDRASGRA